MKEELMYRVVDLKTNQHIVDTLATTEKDMKILRYAFDSLVKNLKNTYEDAIRECNSNCIEYDIEYTDGIHTLLIYIMKFSY